MSIIKQTKNQVIKLFWGKDVVPRGLFELDQYFRQNEPLKFKYDKTNDGIVAVSENFRHGSIVTSGKNEKELDENIKDAILTSFEIPSSYAKEANIIKQGEAQKQYALA